MNAPRQIRDLVSDIVHTYPAAQIELDPLPTGVCFLWVTKNGHNFAMKYHPVDGVGVSENTPETAHFQGHDRVFPTLDEAVTFYKQILAGGPRIPSSSFNRVASAPSLHLQSTN